MSIYVDGGPDGKTPIQCWIIFPSTFNVSTPERHPLFFNIHGGPQLAALDAWSTRWNSLLFAEQGYIVAVPNFTGSDSFGEDFVKAIDEQWGGYPYRDLERCFEWIEARLTKKCDTSRAVAAGASYGGYMANWIAGQPLGKKFKAIVSHDGILDIRDLIGDDVSTENEVATMFGSRLWDPSESKTNKSDAIEEIKESWRRFNPIEYVHNWTTPMLFIHSDKDFRCPITSAWAGYRICKMKGIKTRILNFPDENHFVLNPENSIKWLNVIIGWCNEAVGIKDGIKLEPITSEPKWLGETKEGRIVDGQVLGPKTMTAENRAAAIMQLVRSNIGDYRDS
ncbi:putative oligopeptidase family protein [Phaeomoniella chlamydospora]|uniref:Dipeptidyl-peptidase V n=1 Tax=Phaeomoniella chlamydospora TaxID=158046 RepID=A0A0G2H1G0_PHACM|nr:putative oligopeptidase family protein [Phaeomoniella chlamydospora]